MKLIRLILSVALPGLFPPSLTAQQPSDLKTMAIGDPAPDFSLPGIDDKTWTLANFKDAKLLMVVFTCNHCPSAQAVEPRLIRFVDTYRPKGVAVVAISPNSPAGIRPDELGYSLYGDSFEDMKKHAAREGFNFPYLYDGDKQTTARAYGCLATPHVFLFDAERKLRYKGRFDDSPYLDEKHIKQHDAINAVNALLAGKKVPVTETRPHGCSTKWALKAEHVKKHAEKLNQTPVPVEVIDAEAVAELRKNKTGRYRLVNLWATWCIPCRKEFPDLIRISRKFGLRNFELNSISLDKPAMLQKARAFLEKQGAAPEPKLAKALKQEGRTTCHYLFDGKQDALAEALDPEWPGPLPYTILIDPQGKIIYRHSGIIDAEALTELIVNTMGRYYVPH